MLRCYGIMVQKKGYMMSKKLQAFIAEAKSIDECMNQTCSLVSLGAQSMAKDKLELSHLTILRDLSLELDRLTYTKYLTISPDGLDKYKDASIVEESAERIIEDLMLFIYEQSNKTANVKPYLQYTSSYAFEMSDDRIEKLFETLTVKFNGKKVDKRKPK